MLCYVVFCVLCCVVSCRVVSCRVVSCRVVSCRVVSCRVVSCRVVSCRVVSCRAGPGRAVPGRAGPGRAGLCCAGLGCVMCNGTYRGIEKGKGEIFKLIFRSTMKLRVCVCRHVAVCQHNFVFYVSECATYIFDAIIYLLHYVVVLRCCSFDI